MKANAPARRALPVAAMLAFGLAQAGNAWAQIEATVNAEITPKLYLFDYSKGFGADRTQFLERYNYQKGSDSRSGGYLDADLSMVVTHENRDVFSLERQGFGAYNNRGRLSIDSSGLGFTGSYSRFRSATGGIDYLYSPNQVPGGTDPSYFVPATNTNSGYFAQFNDDAGQALYKIDRTAYAAGLAIKPALLGRRASLFLDYQGYEREGNRFATYVLGGSDVAGGPERVLQRWRGFDMPVNERMDRYKVNFSGNSGGVQLAYDGAIEKFENQARKFTVADFAPLNPLLVSSTKPIHFVPDSTLLSNQLRLSTSFGTTAVAVGYGLSALKQDTFTERQTLAGYGKGEIVTNSAYLNVSSGALSWVRLEGFLKYYDRDNDSTFPAIGLLNPNAGEQLGVRVNSVESLSFGLAGTFRVQAMKSTVTAGWKREDKDRDLTWSAASVGGLNGIQPQRSLYREETVSDELYVNWVARPSPGLTVRVKPSIVRADDTGLVTEPAESFQLKTKLNYVVNPSTALSGYYNYRNRKNDNNTLTDALTAPAVDGTSLAQVTENTQQGAGVALNLMPKEELTLTASLAWMQNDFSSYFIQSNRRRFEAPNNPVLFVAGDEPNYAVDTYVVSLGGDFAASHAVRYSGYYTYSWSKGDNASGYIAAALPAVDQRVDNSAHALTLGADYAVKKNVTLKGMYGYEHYKDKVYPDLTGAAHLVMFGVSIRL